MATDHQPLSATTSLGSADVPVRIPHNRADVPVRPPDVCAARSPTHSTAARWAIPLAALVLLLLIPLVIFGDTFDTMLDGDKAIAALATYGPLAGLVGAGLIVSDLILPIPATAVMAALGATYGWFVGGLISSAASMAAGLLAYELANRFGVRGALWIVSRRDLVRARRWFDRVGVWAVALSRWMPLLPELVCCCAGLASMHRGRFLLALCVGSTAMGFCFAAVPLLNISSSAAVALAAVLPLATWPLVWRLLKTDT